MSMIMSRKSHDPEGSSDYVAGGKPLTGLKVLAIIVSFFFVVFAVDGVMIYKAVKTFSGEVIAHPYERGLAYNREIAQAREQAALDWKVDVQLSRVSPGETEIRVSAHDGGGADVSGVEMSALFAAPADLARDVRVKLEAVAPGRYAGRAALPKGQRDLVLTAARGGQEIFRSRNRIDVE